MNIENTTLHYKSATSSADAIHGWLRSDGVLTQRQIEWCRVQGVALAFDPLQLGWVPLDCEDDVSLAQPSRQGLEFREWMRRDAPALAAMLSAESLWRYLPENYPGPIDEESAAQLIELGRADHHDVSAVIKNNVAIGQVRLLFNEPGSAEVSYWLGEEHWGKGYASEMVRAFCEQSLQDRPDLKRLFAKVHKKNTASQRVLKKASFDLVAEGGDWLTFERLRLPQTAH